MSLAQLVRDSVSSAKSELGDLLITFQYRKKTGSIYAAGKSTPTFAADVDLQGIFDKFESRDIDGTLVKITDSKMILFIDRNELVPNSGDLIFHGSTEYQVVKPNSIFSGSNVILCVVQVRTSV